MGERSASTEQTNGPAAANKQPTMKPPGKALPLDPGPSLLNFGIDHFGYEEISACFHAGQRNYPLQLSCQAQPDLQPCPSAGILLAMARAGGTTAPIPAASIPPAPRGEPEAGCMRWKRSNQVDFSSLVPRKALCLHSCGSLLNTSAF